MFGKKQSTIEQLRKELSYKSKECNILLEDATHLLGVKNALVKENLALARKLKNAEQAVSVLEQKVLKLRAEKPAPEQNTTTKAVEQKAEKAPKNAPKKPRKVAVKKQAKEPKSGKKGK